LKGLPLSPQKTT